MKTRSSLPHNISSRIEFPIEDADCWMWTGKTQRGYGTFYGVLPANIPSTTTAHRIVYEILIGDAGECLNRRTACPSLCVNPEHHVPMSVSECVSLHNQRTHCKSGHEFGSGNTYIRLDDGNRQCLDCKRIKNRWWLARKSGVIDSLEEFTENIERHSPNGCAICGCLEGLQYDHNHATGRFRGMLCGPHNRGIGMFKDDYSAVMGAAFYLLERNPIELEVADG